MDVWSATFAVHQPARNLMWPVMTLTLLLQLTDEEQLYAQAPVEQPAVTQEASHVPDPASALEVTITTEENG
jgi:hypothetical protein